MTTALVDIIEVGPRDGLQSQPTMVDTETKLEFIRRLVEAGGSKSLVSSIQNVCRRWPMRMR